MFQFVSRQGCIEIVRHPHAPSPVTQYSASARAQGHNAGDWLARTCDQDFFSLLRLLDELRQRGLGFVHVDYLHAADSS